jgi:predicted phage terminase large subunit-like protein
MTKTSKKKKTNKKPVRTLVSPKGLTITPEQFAWAAKEHLYAYPQLVSGNVNPPHIHLVAREIQKVIEQSKDELRIATENGTLEEEDFKNTLILLSEPPRHGKTELISKHLPPWYLGKYPSDRIILTSYSSELSTSNSDVAKSNFETWGPVLHDAFPNHNRFNKTSWNTTEKGGVQAAGVSGPITGYGADLFIIDDFFKGWEEAESKLMRDKIWNWWQSVAASRLHPGAVVLIVATRWNDDDLIGRLFAQYHEEGKEFPFKLVYLNFPAIAEESDDRRYKKYKDPLGRKEGEALWPGRYNKMKLERIKKMVGPYWWNALYQGRPVNRGGNLFKSHTFRYFERDQYGNYICHRKDKEPIVVKKKDLNIHCYVDPAIEEKTVNDPTGMAVWAYCRKNKIWLLLDRFNKRISPTIIEDEILTFAFKYKSSLVGVENEKIGKIIVKQSAGKDSKGGMKIPFKEIPTKGLDKYTRAVPMATYCENERVFFPMSASWLGTYEDYLTRFPQVDHDEDIDITAMASNMESQISVTEALSSMRGK